MKSYRKEMKIKSRIKRMLRTYQVLYVADKKAVILCFPVAFLRALTPYIALLATSYILDGFMSGIDYRLLLSAAFGAIVLTFLVRRCEDWLRRTQTLCNEIAVKKIYLDCAEKYVHLEYDMLEGPKIHEINERIRRDNNWGSGFANLSRFLNSSLDNLFAFIIGVIVLIPLAVQNNISGIIIFVASLMIFATVISIFNSNVVSKKITQLLNSNNIEDKTEKRMTDVYTYLVWGQPISEVIQTSRIYNMRSVVLPYVQVADKTTREFGKKFSRLSVLRGIISNLSSGVLIAASYLFIVARAVTGSVSVGNIILLTSSIYNMVEGFRALSETTCQMLDQSDRLESTLEFLALPTVKHQGTSQIGNLEQYDIEFKNVSFKYPGNEKFALKNLSIKLTSGKKHAIVGMNGSGKTTMIKLLCRLYDPSEGEITLNGVNINSFDYDQYTKIFSVVFQDFILLSFGLGENLACKEDYSESLATEVLEKARFAERLKTMPNGLKSYLYNDFDEGVEVSGGEAQKIALARALYKNSPFVILDEPTSALDPIAEHEIYSNFNSISGTKTVVYISHRLSSCRFCDQIAVFNSGELVQLGNHDTLVKDKSGKYFELWTAQAQYYSESNSYS